jgi:hypothetical protein
MIHWSRVIAGWILGICIAASVCVSGELTGRVVITKGLTKKRVTLPSYQLRTVASPFKQQDSTSVSELDRLAIYLEGPELKGGIPVHVKLNQKNIRFEPEIRRSSRIDGLLPQLRPHFP